MCLRIFAYLEVATNIILSQSSVIITVFITLRTNIFLKNFKASYSAGLLKVYIGYLFIGAPISEDSVLSLKDLAHALKEIF